MLLIAVGLYLLIGFCYAVYVVLVGGGGLFSIPINMLFGPIYFPYVAVTTFFEIKRSRRKYLKDKEVQKLAEKKQDKNPQ